MNQKQTIRKLQTAIHQRFGVKLLFNTRQFYTSDNRPLTLYILQQQVKDNNGKETKIELWKTYSLIQMVLFLRDYWYKLNGWEVPTDNIYWEEVKKKFGREETDTDKSFAPDAYKPEYRRAEESGCNS